MANNPLEQGYTEEGSASAPIRPGEAFWDNSTEDGYQDRSRLVEERYIAPLGSNGRKRDGTRQE